MEEKKTNQKEDADEGEERSEYIQQAEKPRYSVVAITAILCYI